MSGHSKWSQIKRQKGANDAKKSAVFTKLAHAITVAARQGGNDPDMNFSLRLAIDRARAANMPKDNIERSIKRGTGELQEGELHEMTYEAFGPEGVALVIEALTDNKNRMAADIKHLLSEHAGRLGGPGSTRWMFDLKGVLEIASESLSNHDQDALELQLIDAGASDLHSHADGITVYATPADLQAVKTTIESLKIPIADAQLQLIPKTPTSISDAARGKVLKLVDALEAHDDITNVYVSL